MQCKRLTFSVGPSCQNALQTHGTIFGPTCRYAIDNKQLLQPSPGRQSPRNFRCTDVNGDEFPCNRETQSRPQKGVGEWGAPPQLPRGYKFENRSAGAIRAEVHQTIFAHPPFFNELYANALER